MDTRFWGPSGWKFLHLLTQDASRCRNIVKWLKLLPYVLPCKYCRASLHDYYEIQPLTEEIFCNPETAGKWMYDIHNRVNGKLRGQGLLTENDPSWPEIQKKYHAMYKGLCVTSPLIGWDFMSSIAFTTPSADYRPVPMQDAPESPADWLSLDIPTKNRFNLLTYKERLEKLAIWWKLIPSILPCSSWRQSWASSMKNAGRPPLSKGRDAMMLWMWKIEEGVCSSLKCATEHSSLPALHSQMKRVESNCSSSRKGKTCRSKKRKLRRTRRL
jgi:hypothetical protein